MRSLEQIHLDELGTYQGVATNLTWSYAVSLAKAAAERYARNFGVFERTRDRDLSLARFSVSTSWQGEHRPMVEVFKPKRSSSRTPLPVAEPTIAGGGIPDPLPVPTARPGDRIIYRYASRQQGEASKWDGATVTGIVDSPPFKGQLYVTALDGSKGIIPANEAEKIQAPESRSTTHKTVACYRLLLSTSQRDGKQRYHRLALRSIPRDLEQDTELEYLDSLIQTTAIENDLDVAELFTMQNAPRFEEELSEGRLIV
jgi:hypothetical protein